MTRMRLASAPMAALVLLALAACTPTPAALTSPWPVATAERGVPKPPVPPRWPLTGHDAASEEVVRRRVVSVKIENSPDSKPQVGLDRADVVYESLAEGGITRFNAIFHSNAPDYLVGPVRSARLSDLHIVPQYGALFVFSGANAMVDSKVNAAGLENLSEDTGVAACYTRVLSRRAPHNLFVDIDDARSVAASKGWPTSRTVSPLAFGRGSAEETPHVGVIGVPFSDQAKARWQYDDANGVYLRWDRGKPHTDGETGKQLSAKNVVVIWAKTTTTGKRDVAGSPTLDIDLSGKGRATLFSDGVKTEGEWMAGKDAPPVLRKADGSSIKLAPGNTWFQVIPTNANIVME